MSKAILLQECEASQNLIDEVEAEHNVLTTYFDPKISGRRAVRMGETKALRCLVLYSLPFAFPQKSRICLRKRAEYESPVHLGTSNSERPCPCAASVGAALPLCVASVRVALWP